MNEKLSLPVISSTDQNSELHFLVDLHLCVKSVQKAGVFKAAIQFRRQQIIVQEPWYKMFIFPRSKLWGMYV